MIRIILADDHTMLRQGLRLLLGRADDVVIVGECGRGDEALDMIRLHRPDVALLDISMPGMDGITVTTKIRREGIETAVVVMTTYDDHQMIQRAALSGAQGYVLKDLAFETLVDVIRQVASGASLLQEYLPEEVLLESETITDREKEVLALIAQGLTNRLMAEKLHISIKTVDSHRTNLMRKLGLHSTAELVRYAYRTGLFGQTTTPEP